MASDKQLKVKVLYFDEETCTRCINTISILEETLTLFKKTYPSIIVEYIKIKVTEKDIEISPTILINGLDLEVLVKSQNESKKVSECKDCSCIARKNVCCRDYSKGVIDQEVITKVLVSQI